MLKNIIYQYFTENGLQFPEQARPRLEMDKALLFFGGQCFAFAFLLFALSPKMPALWPGAGLHLTIALFVIGVGCLFVLAKRRVVVVQKDDPVADDLLSMLFEHEQVGQRVKKYIAIEIKRQGYVSYRQLFAFGELQHHRSMHKDSKALAGAAAFVKALDEGNLQ